MLALAHQAEVIDLLPTLMQISAQTNEEFCFFYCACTHNRKVYTYVRIFYIPAGGTMCKFKVLKWLKICKRTWRIFIEPVTTNKFVGQAGFSLAVRYLSIWLNLPIFYLELVLKISVMVV